MSLKIGIVGKMASGKTTSADYLLQYSKQFHKYSFACKLKQIATELFDMKEKDRQLLINIGSKMREIDSDVWAKYTLKCCNKYSYVVIDDVRYLNEYHLLKQNGWKIIKLNISEKLQEERLKNTYPDTFLDHLSHKDNITENDAVNLDNSFFDLVINVDHNSIEQELYKFVEKNLK